MPGPVTSHHFESRLTALLTIRALLSKSGPTTRLAYASRQLKSTVASDRGGGVTAFPPVIMLRSVRCLAAVQVTNEAYLDDIRSDLRLRGITRAVRDHDAPALFDG